MAQSSNPMDYLAIRNTLSQYCDALDSKDFNKLREVFTEKTDAKYPFGNMSNIQEVADAIKARLEHITSQHALTTQTIEVAEDGQTASAMTYFTAIHFGKGKWQGQQLSVWGKYIDRLVLVPGGKSLPGVNGRWLIQAREVLFMGRLGENEVMKGE